PPPSAHPFARSLHDALPISPHLRISDLQSPAPAFDGRFRGLFSWPDRLKTLWSPNVRVRDLVAHRLHHKISRKLPDPACTPLHRSEEHTSELQSRFDIVCRL